MRATFKPIRSHRDYEVYRATRQCFDTIPTNRVSIQENLLRSEYMSSVAPNRTLVHFQCYDLRAL